MLTNQGDFTPAAANITPGAAAARLSATLSASLGLQNGAFPNLSLHSMYQNVASSLNSSLNSLARSNSHPPATTPASTDSSANIGRNAGSFTPPMLLANTSVDPSMHTKDEKQPGSGAPSLQQLKLEHSLSMSSLPQYPDLSSENGDKLKVQRRVCFSPVHGNEKTNDAARTKKRRPTMRRSISKKQRSKKSRLSSPPSSAEAESESQYSSSDSTKQAARLSGRWTTQEHDRFLEGLRKFGKDWRNIAMHIGTRNYVQTRTHAQKYFKKVAKVKRGMGEEIPVELMSTANNGKKWDFAEGKEGEGDVEGSRCLESGDNAKRDNSASFGTQNMIINNAQSGPAAALVATHGMSVGEEEKGCSGSTPNARHCVAAAAGMQQLRNGLSGVSVGGGSLDNRNGAGNGNMSGEAGGGGAVSASSGSKGLAQVMGQTSGTNQGRGTFPVSQALGAPFSGLLPALANAYSFMNMPMNALNPFLGLNGLNQNGFPYLAASNLDLLVGNNVKNGALNVSTNAGTSASASSNANPAPITTSTANKTVNTQKI